MKPFRFKQVIIVRSDLKMGKGKAAAQVAHASLLSAEKARTTRRGWYKRWMKEGQAKIVVRVGSIEELMEVKKRAVEAGLPVAAVEDRGLTQLPAGTATCVGIGPAPASLVDPITGGLRLL